MSNILRRYGRQLALLLILIIEMVVLGQMSPYFLRPASLLNLSTHLAETGIIAVGMTMVIMTGGIDLSVGSLLALTGVIFGTVLKTHGLPMALVAGGATALAGGVLNGLLIARGKLPALVVTLATLALFRGLAMVVSQAQPVSGFPKSFTWIGQGNTWLLGQAIPIQLIIWVVVALLGMVLVDRTVSGRRLVAIGDNPTAALNAALPVRSLIAFTYILTGLLAGLSAFVFTARVNTAKADAAVGLELEVIVAVVLGGTAMTGGRGTVLGTTLGVLILGLLRQGLTLARIPTIYQTILAGAILIAVSILNQWLISRGGRRRPSVTTAATVAEPQP